MEGEKESVLPSVEERIGGAQTLKNKEKFFREIMTPTHSE